MPKLQASRVGKIFPGRLIALQDIDLSVASNEFVALVGASGCGKSTLLRIIAGLETPSSGELYMDGLPITGPGRERAVVFQDYSLYPWLTVKENVTFSRQLKVNRNYDSANAAAAMVDRAYALLELMGLMAVKDRYPKELSGGMRQRVAIARALLSRPQVLLMDEPFGALDAQTREVMHELILHLFTIERTTIVFVTHDVEEAVYLADRVVVLAPHPGRVDSEFAIDLPPSAERQLDLKLEPHFLRLKKAILERIRATSGVQRDLAALKRLTRDSTSIPAP